MTVVAVPLCVCELEQLVTEQLRHWFCVNASVANGIYLSSVNAQLKFITSLHIFMLFSIPIQMAYDKKMLIVHGSDITQAESLSKTQHIIPEVDFNRYSLRLGSTGHSRTDEHWMNSLTNISVFQLPC